MYSLGSIPETLRFARLPREALTACIPFARNILTYKFVPTVTQLCMIGEAAFHHIYTVVGTWHDLRNSLASRTT